MEKIKDESHYVLRPAANCEATTPVLYAEVAYNPAEKKAPKMEIEVYKDPVDFCQQLTQSLQFQIGDELIDRGLMESMRVTLIVEYEQETKPKAKG